MLLHNSFTGNGRLAGMHHFAQRLVAGGEFRGAAALNVREGRFPDRLEWSKQGAAQSIGLLLSRRTLQCTE